MAGRPDNLADKLLDRMWLGQGPYGRLRWTRRQGAGRSRYTPHVGPRELARRARNLRRGMRAGLSREALAALGLGA